MRLIHGGPPPRHCRTNRRGKFPRQCGCAKPLLRPETTLCHTLRHLGPARVAMTSRQPLFPTCHGREQASSMLINWAEKKGIVLTYIQHGKPQQNAYVERHDRTVRHEWPDIHILDLSRRCSSPQPHGYGSATYVTAPSARGILKHFLTRCRVLTYVRPHDATSQMPRARMVFADQAPNQRRVLGGTLLQAGSSDPVSRPLHQTSPCPLPLRRPRDRWSAYAATTGDW